MLGDVRSDFPIGGVIAGDGCYGAFSDGVSIIASADVLAVNADQYIRRGLF